MDTKPTEGFDAALTLTDTLDYLPSNKRRELARVLEIIFSEVGQFRATKLSAKQSNGEVLKVILYESYARGDWVEDRLSGYRSDYDILVVVDSDGFAQEQELWLALDERLLKEQIAHLIETPVIPIVYSLHDVNDQLSRGRPFFVDIAKDGKILYEENGHPLAQAKALTSEERNVEAQRYFDEWSQNGRGFLKAEEALGQEYPKQRAFLLYQAAKTLYHCLLLTLGPLRSKIAPHQDAALQGRGPRQAADRSLALRQQARQPALRTPVTRLCRGSVLAQLRDQHRRSRMAGGARQIPAGAGESKLPGEVGKSRSGVFEPATLQMLVP